MGKNGDEDTKLYHEVWDGPREAADMKINPPLGAPNTIAYARPKNRWTWYEIELLMHFDCAPTRPFPRDAAPGYIPTCRRLQELGLLGQEHTVVGLVPGDLFYTNRKGVVFWITPRGKAFINALQNTPMPPDVDELYRSWCDNL